MKEENINNLNYAVIDASVAAAFLLPDEQDDLAVKIFDRNTTGKLKLISTSLLPYEIANLLFACVKSKRLDKELALKLLKRFLKFKIELLSVDFYKTLNISINSGVSVYDASYIFLSEKENAPLLTFDKQLQKLTLGN